MGSSRHRLGNGLPFQTSRRHYVGYPASYILGALQQVMHALRILIGTGIAPVTHGLHERFGHAIALGRTLRRVQRLKAQFPSEAARAVVDGGRAVVRQPFDGLRCLRGAEALLDGCQHHVAHYITAMSVGRRRPANRFPVAAVQRERYAQRRAILAPELKAIGAPAGVAAVHRNATVMAPLCLRPPPRRENLDIAMCRRW